MKNILCIIGTIASGKDVVAEYISSKLGVPPFQISQPLKDFAKKNNIKPNRENLEKIGSKFVQEYGSGFIVKSLVDKASNDFIIITGVRRTEIVEYMRKNYNLILLAITAKPEIRFQRSLIRNKFGEAKTLSEFVEKEQRENSAPSHQRLFECLKLADYTIDNNADLETLSNKIDEFLKLKGLGKK